MKKTKPDMKQLLQTAATTARAHRDAVRLLLQGIDDSMEEDSESLRDFFVDFLTHDALSEVHAYTRGADRLLLFVKAASAACITDELQRTACGQGAKRDSALARYAAITEEVMERADGTCPCRDCVASRGQAAKIASACVQKARRQVIRESKESKE